MEDFTKDYYKILDINSSSTADEIKLAYRKQAKKYHPDLNPDRSESENLIKEINEAYEVLGNKDKRFAYDQFWLDKKRQELKEKTQEEKVSKNKKCYTKTVTVYTEEQTYVKGIIFIKYFGKHIEQASENILLEISYKITITQTDAVIEHLVRHSITKEFQDVFAVNKPIKLNIKQPIRCKVKDKNDAFINYKLEILNLTIPNPKIINVTQHEEESFGTITGTFYGYVKEDKAYNETVIVEECSGETGKTEEKNENGINYYRKEYYNANCSKYWGNWVAKIAKPTTTATGKTENNGNYTRKEYYYSDYKKTYWGAWKKQSKTIRTQNSGCLGSVGNILGLGLSCLYILCLSPQLVFLLPFLFIPFFLNLLPAKIWNWILRIFFGLFGLIFTIAILASLVSNYHKIAGQVHTKPKEKIIKPKYIAVLDSNSNQKIIDTLICHNVTWNDYDGKAYEGNFSVKKSLFDLAHSYKENLNIPVNNENNYDRMIFNLKEHDKDNLKGIYSMFDSIRLSNKPNTNQFAEIIVSFVQSIPYTIVLPKSCDAGVYQDEFTTKYLASPNARCDGFEKYGINTPVEFMTYLNGDCDTRTLFLYTILSHYNYDVALLSSSHYSHSILGINLSYEGAIFQNNNQRYVFWETTAQNLKPGMLPNEISNTDYWRISLKSK